MPACAPIHHVKDDVLLHEQQITLYLIIVCVWQFGAAGMVWARPGPSPTNLTGLNDLWNQVHYSFRDTNAI